MNFNFRVIDSEKDVFRLEGFLLSQSLGYPNYSDWVERSVHEILMGYKQAVLAFSEGRLVGDLVYQPHKELPDTLELKNLRMHPLLRGRGFGYFMIRQAEVENAGFSQVVCDVRASQIDVVNLFRHSKYKEVFRAPLYNSSEEDIVFAKSLKAA